MDIWILDWVYRFVRIFHPGLEPILSPNVHRWGLVLVLLLLRVNSVHLEHVFMYILFVLIIKNI